MSTTFKNDPGLTPNKRRYVRKQYEHRAEGRINSLEKEILQMMARGQTTTEISEALRYSHGTIEGYRLRMFRHLGVRNGCEAVAFAIRNKLID